MIGNFLKWNQDNNNRKCVRVHGRYFNKTNKIISKLLILVQFAYIFVLYIM